MQRSSSPPCFGSRGQHTASASAQEDPEVTAGACSQSSLPQTARMKDVLLCTGYWDWSHWGLEAFPLGLSQGALRAGHHDAVKQMGTLRDRILPTAIDDEWPVMSSTALRIRALSGSQPTVEPCACFMQPYPTGCAPPHCPAATGGLQLCPALNGGVAFLNRIHTCPPALEGHPLHTPV